jgi:hypothetical protein
MPGLRPGDLGATTTQLADRPQSATTTSMSAPKRLTPPESSQPIRGPPPWTRPQTCCDGRRQRGVQVPDGLGPMSIVIQTRHPVAEWRTEHDAREGEIPFQMAVQAASEDVPARFESLHAALRPVYVHDQRGLPPAETQAEIPSFALPSRKYPGPRRTSCRYLDPKVEACRW